MFAMVDLRSCALLYLGVMTELGSLKLDVATGKFLTASRVICAFGWISRLLVPLGNSVFDAPLPDAD